MAVREYVGARYVPIFSDVNGGVWDNTHAYEPLTIVKYGNDYYTSRKPVPVGVAITNTQYWVLTGEYNGAIASLQQDIQDLDERVDWLQDGGDIIAVSDNIAKNLKAYRKKYASKIVVANNVIDTDSILEEYFEKMPNERFLTI